MKRRFSVVLVVILFGSILVACGRSSPKGESETAPAEAPSASSQSEPVIFEENFEAGEDPDWSDSEAATGDQEREPEAPEQD